MHVTLYMLRNVINALFSSKTHLMWWKFSLITLTDVIYHYTRVDSQWSQRNATNIAWNEKVKRIFMILSENQITCTYFTANKKGWLWKKSLNRMSFILTWAHRIMDKQLLFSGQDFPPFRKFTWTHSSLNRWQQLFKVYLLTWTE